MHALRQLAIKVLPKRFVEWYRRRRALKHYLTALAYEIYDRGVRLELDDLEGRIAARRDGFYDRLVRDVLERTELVLQQLDRKIEGLGARQGAELRHLVGELESLRESLHSLDSRMAALGGAPRESTAEEAPGGTSQPVVVEGSPATADR